MNPSDTDSVTVDNSKVKANILNEYFARLLHELANEIYLPLSIIFEAS